MTHPTCQLMPNPALSDMPSLAMTRPAPPDIPCPATPSRSRRSGPSPTMPTAQLCPTPTHPADPNPIRPSTHFPPPTRLVSPCQITSLPTYHAPTFPTSLSKPGLPQPTRLPSSVRPLRARQFSPRPSVPDLPGHSCPNLTCQLGPFLLAPDKPRLPRTPPTTLALLALSGPFPTSLPEPSQASPARSLPDVPVPPNPDPDNPGHPRPLPPEPTCQLFPVPTVPISSHLSRPPLPSQSRPIPTRQPRPPHAPPSRPTDPSQVRQPN